jgi:hypothetical protein
MKPLQNLIAIIGIVTALAAGASERPKAEKLSPFQSDYGNFTKAEFLDINLKSSERLNIRYCPIADSGVELELVAGSTVLWRERVQALGISHYDYRHDVSVRIEDGKIHVTSTGAKKIHEIRDLKTGRQISRQIDEPIQDQRTSARTAALRLTPFFTRSRSLYC